MSPRQKEAPDAHRYAQPAQSDPARNDPVDRPGSVGAVYEMLGFEKRNDGPWGDGYRWVELYPPNTPTGIALVPPGPGDTTSVQTGIIFNADDIDATHAQLQALGVDVDESVARVGAPAEIRIGAVQMAGPEPPMFYFRDPDGNFVLIVQPG